MHIEIKEVKSKKDLNKFVTFPFKLYKENKYWAPGFISDEKKLFRAKTNPAFEYCDVKCWLAYKDGKVAGRIAGIINQKYINKWKNKYARFGWVDFIDDREVSKALFTTVENWSKENDLTGIQGPMGFTDFDEEGMLVEGFEELGTLPMIYNYPYYPQHIDALGYKKEVDWLEFEIKAVNNAISDKVLRVQALVLKRSGLKLVIAKKPKDLLPYAHGIFEVINEAYSHLFGFVELSDKQIEVYTKQYFSFIQPDYTKVIVDKNDKVVAFGIAMPSLTYALQKAKGRLFPFGFIHLLKALKHPKYIDLYLTAVKPEYQSRGVNSIVMAEITKSSIKNGIISAETSGELEDNKAVQDLWRYYDKRQHKRRRCYLKKI